MNNLFYTVIIFLLFSVNCYGIDLSDQKNNLDELYAYAIGQLGIDFESAQSAQINDSKIKKMYVNQSLRNASNKKTLIPKSPGFQNSYSDDTVGKFEPNALELITYGVILGLAAWGLSAVLDGSTTDELPTFLLLGAGIGAITYVISL